MTINDFKKVIVRDYRHAPQNTPLRLPIVGRCCAILRMAPLCNGYGLVQRWLAQDQLGFVKKKGGNVEALAAARQIIVGSAEARTVFKAGMSTLRYIHTCRQAHNACVTHASICGSMLGLAPGKALRA